MVTFVNVDDFAGTDQQKVDQAITAISATGGTLVFPKRGYSINGFELKSNMNVIGNGATLNQITSSNTAIITLGLDAENINIEGLILDGNKANQSGNFARGILFNPGARRIRITRCVFNNIRRLAILIDNCRDITISDIAINGAGIAGVQYGNGVQIYNNSENILVENLRTIDNFGEGLSVAESKRVVLRNHYYSTSSPSFATGDNGITITKCSDVIIEDVEASNMQNQGIEINSTDRFKLSNLNLHHNGVYNLMISVFTDTGEQRSYRGEVTNVSSADAGSDTGINVIGCDGITFNNIQDNKKTRFVRSSGGLDLINVEVKNSTFNVLELHGAKGISFFNTTYQSNSFADSTYSSINHQNKLDIYFQANLNHNQHYDVTVPFSAGGGTTLFNGLLNVDNTFVPSASFQFTSKLVHVKLIWTSDVYLNIISTINGSISARDFSIVGGSNQLRITNISGVATTLRGNLSGINVIP